MKRDEGVTGGGSPRQTQLPRELMAGGRAGLSTNSQLPPGKEVEGMSLGTQTAFWVRT